MSSSLPKHLYTSTATRELDRVAIEDHGIPGIKLMKRAGQAAFTQLLEKWPSIEKLIVLCGGGNNAGDGYVVAALASQRCIDVEVQYLVAPSELKGDAKLAYEYAIQESVAVDAFSESVFSELPVGTVVVDALLGTGLKGEVRSEYRQAIELLNAAQLPVLALDIPSGLCADTGAELGCAVKAASTVTFIGCKQGLLTGRAPAIVGELVYADLDVPQAVFASVEASTARIALGDLLDYLPEREADSHKGRFGHCMIIGGDYGYGGAGVMAAESAAYTGAGMVSLATQPEHVAPSLMRRPEIMAVGVVSGQSLEPYLVCPSVLVVGPGLGQRPWGEQMFLQACKTELPIVADADALNLLATRFQQRAPRDNWILTPHVGEAARLLSSSVEAVQADRFAAVIALQKKYGGVVVLKGAGTLIADGACVVLADVGNPGMATAGSGDILSGVIGALLAQGLDCSTAAQLGVCLHGEAGDLAAEDVGQNGLLASEMAPYIRELINS